jgi:hypothetical protein
VGALRRGYAIVLRQSIFKASAVDNLEARRAGGVGRSATGLLQCLGLLQAC